MLLGKSFLRNFAHMIWSPAMPVTDDATLKIQSSVQHAGEGGLASQRQRVAAVHHQNIMVNASNPVVRSVQSTLVGDDMFMNQTRSATLHMNPNRSTEDTR